MRSIIAALAAFAFLASPASADWIAFVGDQGGYGFGSHPSSKAKALQAAVKECMKNDGVECNTSSPTGLAVTDDWHLVVVYCRRAHFVGASPDSKEAAFDDAIRRSQYDIPESCSIVDSR